MLHRLSHWAGFRSWSLRRRLLMLLAAIVYGLLVVQVAPGDRQWTTLSNRMNDAVFYGGFVPSGRVVIVAVDDESVRQKGSFGTWPRRWHGEVAQTLRRRGARVVTFDLLLSDANNPADDALAGAAFAEAGNIVVGVAGEGSARRGHHALSYSSMLEPLAAFAAAAPGHVNVVPDRDGVVRRMPLFVSHLAAPPYQTLGLATAWQFWALPPAAPITWQGNTAQLPNGLALPADQNGMLLVNFAAPPAQLNQTAAPGAALTVPDAPFAVYRYADVLDRPELLPAAAFQEKIVLIGSMATAVNDVQLTPVSSQGEPMSGVEIHANVIETLLGQQFLRPPSPGWTVAWVLVIAGLIGLAAFAARPGLVALVGTALTLATIFGGIVASVNLRILPNLLAPLVSSIGATTLVLLTIAIYGTRDKRRILQVFERRTTPQVMRELLRANDQGRLQLGGERREVSVLFADLRGYTAFAEMLPPEEVIGLLNAYLSIGTEVITAAGGTINQFAGDQIMAVWNAPLDTPDHEAAACRAGLAVQSAIRAFQASPAGQALPRLQFGIGINSGPGISGNIGSLQRFDYTVVGDTTNLAARICAQTPGGEVYIGPRTTAAVAGRVLLQELGPHTFKGKREPLVLARVLADGQ